MTITVGIDICLLLRNGLTFERYGQTDLGYYINDDDDEKEYFQKLLYFGLISPHFEMMPM